MRTNHHIFERLIAKCERREAVPVAVAFSCDEPSLVGRIEAARHGLIVPVLVGPRADVVSVANAQGIDVSPYRIVDPEDDLAAAARAVARCRGAECAALMKDSLST